jgi:hypothetical protein
VDTQHLLEGILAEGTSDAAHILAETGVTAYREPHRHPAAGLAAPWAGLAGERLPAVLELASEWRATGTMTVRQAAVTATLHFLFGHLFHAVRGAQTGDEAVIAALAAGTDAEVDFDAGSKLPGNESVILSVPDLIKVAQESGPPKR